LLIAGRGFLCSMINSISNQGKLLVLMVDDNLGFVERMKGLLEEVNVVSYINVASDYNEAFRSVGEERPDIVLLDINLPGKSGIEVLKKIRLNDLKCKVVMLTNHADDYYRKQCNELGADYFLDKSSDFAKVPDIIRKLYSEHETVC
jgi:DNA-binding NarL/FixJ family response regulator